MIARYRAETDNPSNRVTFHFLERDEHSYSQVIRDDIVGMRRLSRCGMRRMMWCGEQCMLRNGVY
jgi:hypothetical protein